MTILNAFDYSWARPDPPAMRKSGILATARYLWNGGKGLTKSELQALHSEGIHVPVNFEADAGDHLLGAPKGAENGKIARDLAHAGGVPTGTPIYYSCDRQTFPGQMSAAMDYLHAADDPSYPSRAYGQFDVIEAFARPGWQTIAWSNLQLSKHAVLYQWAIDQTFQGSAVDYNQILDLANLGAWYAPGYQPPTPAPKPGKSEDSMQYKAFEDTSTGAYYLAFPGHFQHVSPLQWRYALIRDEVMRDPATGKPLLNRVSHGELNVHRSIYLGGNS